jgi:two-component system nitrogen regulation sensor histidine kinase NtrY
MEQIVGLAEEMEESSPTLFGSPRLNRLAAPLAGATLLATAAFAYWLISRPQQDDTLLSAPVVALLLIMNLLPAIMLLVLTGQHIARRRAARSLVGGSGRLHVRLVALFSIVASLPLLLVVIFASLLFQYGVQFWFSADARGMLQNATTLARGYYQSNLKETGNETVTMAKDLRDYLGQSEITSPAFAEGYIYQVVTRKLNRSAIIEIGKDGVARTAATVDPEQRTATEVVTPDVIKRLRAGEPVVVQAKPNQIEAFVQLYPDSNTFLYATRDSAADAFSEMKRAQAVLADYEEFATRSRQLQLQFNIALFIGTLMLVGTAVWVALVVADRLVRPVGELVDAARRVTAGDLSTRVADRRARDELGTLAGAFNRMTQRLEAQTGALVSANSQLANRRALIEAVLSGVSAGVISVDQHGVIQLLNSSAMVLLVQPGIQAVGQPLSELSQELADLMAAGSGSDIIQIRTNGEIRTLAVQVVAEGGNRVLTFDDITQQLLDQRRAAWSDVARRIAHEIKNPLTPIQLAAERLQRRYGKEIQSDPGTFSRLTGTIVRQVGDLRRIVDEFTSFARMPKPVFREEALIDLERHAMFLQEVAHPDVSFTFESEEAEPMLVCDRRQIGQALTNVVKNAVEAIEQRHLVEAAPDENSEPQKAPHGHVAMSLAHDDGEIVITVADDGIGLPVERERIIEPYMTTRAKGTGLGLAIVKKIVEEHFGSIAFGDAQNGGTIVTLRFDVTRLARLAEDGDERLGDSVKETLNGA